MMRRAAALLTVLVIAGGSARAGQVPQPFPGRPTPAKPGPAPAPGGTTQAPASPAPPPATSAAPAAAEGAPTEVMLGVPIYPAAQFITSYDAGRGQRYYLFGSDAAFPVLVKYYQTVLKNKGNLVFDAPAVHMFEVGRFRDETMAFPPGVTVKDYTWNGSAGYMNPQRDGKPARFPSIIQIVPVPPGSLR